MIRRAATVAILIMGIFLFSGCDPDESENPDNIQFLDHVIYSSDYQNHRFFRLDLPLQETPDGRAEGDEILHESIRIFQLLPGEPDVGDITNVATYVDSLGLRIWGDTDFSQPYLFGRRWLEIYGSSWDTLLDADGNLIAVDFKTRMDDGDILAVIYDVKLSNGSIIEVGDRPGVDLPEQEVEDGEGLYYRMKLLKAPVSDQEAYTFQYVLRNIYSLGRMNIDYSTFDLRIERNVPATAEPHLDENGLAYIRIF